LVTQEHSIGGLVVPFDLVSDTELWRRSHVKEYETDLAWGWGIEWFNPVMVKVSLLSSFPHWQQSNFVCTGLFFIPSRNKSKWWYRLLSFPRFSPPPVTWCTEYVVYSDWLYYLSEFGKSVSVGLMLLRGNSLCVYSIRVYQRLFYQFCNNSLLFIQGIVPHFGIYLSYLCFYPSKKVCMSISWYFFIWYQSPLFRLS